MALDRKPLRYSGQFAYGALFMLALPALWCAWAWRLDRSEPVLWPVPFPPWLGLLSAFAGFALMLTAMVRLWRVGKGLPMNAYPPRRFVGGGPYALFAHPIYLGFVLAVAGISIAAGSRAGLWVLTPISALAVMALVAGYEGPRLKARFAQAARHAPLFGLPPAGPGAARFPLRLAATAITLVPWALAYATFSRLPAPAAARDLRMAWEQGIPLQGWAVWIYLSAYPLAVAGPLLLRTCGELKRFVVGGWLLSVAGFATMLLVGGRAPWRPLEASPVAMALLDANRVFDAEWLALPAFHVAWMVLAGACCMRHHPRLRLPCALGVGLIGLSCVLTGSHALADVLAGLVLGGLCWHHGRVWQALLRWTEALANSWSAFEVGPVRVISHALWSALAAFAGLSVVGVLAGPGLERETAGIFAAGLLAAGAWGHLLEGGGRLSRPFGYYGFLLGCLLALAVLALAAPGSAQRLAAALACGAPLAQAIGRLRCLVQGCCHGRPVVRSHGIHVTHPRSRVTALGGLHGVAIHPTPLYSIIANLLIFACLVRLHSAGAGASLIGGLYLILSSLARFVEEEYRGEPQTRRVLDLAIYQWLAIATFVLGIPWSMLPGPAVAPPALQNWKAAVPLGAALAAAACMSMDFPRSRRRFSRLTVGDPGA